MIPRNVGRTVNYTSVLSGRLVIGQPRPSVHPGNAKWHACRRDSVTALTPVSLVFNFLNLHFQLVRPNDLRLLFLSDKTSPTGGIWHRGVYCDIGLYWNPNFPGNHHGGSCDFWDNLSPEVQELYRLDLTCPTPPLDCYWEADPKCDNKYFYLPEKSKNINNLQHLSCPVGLYWNQTIRACGLKCSHDPKCLIC